MCTPVALAPNGDNECKREDRMMVFSRGVIEQPSSSGEWVSGKSSKTSSWGNAFLFTVLSLMRTMATKLHMISLTFVATIQRVPLCLTQGSVKFSHEFYWPIGHSHTTAAVQPGREENAEGTSKMKINRTYINTQGRPIRATQKNGKILL